MIIEKHTLALFSIVGCSLDVLGSLYLTYDLLGGEHGPLRTLSRGVTYGVLFGVGFGLAIGPLFGLAAGAAHGITLAWEYSRESRHAPKPGFWEDAAMSLIRGAGFGFGAAHLYGIKFGITFGALSTAGQIVAYKFGLRPTMNYKPASRPRLTKFQILATLNRAVGYAVAGWISSLIANQRETALPVALSMGLGIGAVTLIALAATPLIEWVIVNVPAKRMGVFGVVLLLIGFALQSVQYWVALLDVSIAHQ